MTKSLHRPTPPGGAGRAWAAGVSAAVGLVLAAALCATASPVGAATYLLDFDRSQDICVDGQESATSTPCANGKFISQSYGDQPGVNVEWDTRTVEGLQNFGFWTTDYADLTDVAYYDVGSTLTFFALAGYEVGLAGLSLGGFGPTSSALPERITVTDLFDLSVLFDSGEQTIPGTGNPALAFDFTDLANPFGFTSTTGLKLTFHLRSGIVGVDNIRYSATPTTTPPPTEASPVPLPAGLPLLLGGLCLLRFLRRRRQS